MKMFEYYIQKDDKNLFGELIVTTIDDKPSLTLKSYQYNSKAQLSSPMGFIGLDEVQFYEKGSGNFEKAKSTISTCYTCVIASIQYMLLIMKSGDVVVVDSRGERHKVFPKRGNIRISNIYANSLF